MDRDAFWSSDDDDDVLAEYLAEHAYDLAFDGEDRIVIGVGNHDRLPDLPTPAELAERAAARIAGALCTLCSTPIREIPHAGWRHLLGFADRDGCTAPLPAI